MNSTRVGVGLILAVIGLVVAYYAFQQPLGPTGTLMAALGGALLFGGLGYAYRGFKPSTQPGTTSPAN